MEIVNPLAQQLHETESFIRQAQIKRANNLIERRTSVIKVVTIVAGISCLIQLVIDLFDSSSQTSNLLSTFFTYGAAIVLCVGLYLAANKVTTLSQTYLVIKILLGATAVLMLVSALYGSVNLERRSLTFVIVPILIGLLGLTTRQMAFAGFFLAFVQGYPYIRAYIDTPNRVINWSDLASRMIILAIVVFGVIIFNRRIVKSDEETQEQLQRFLQLLTTIDETNQFGKTLSQQLSGTSTELGIASRQQAAGTQEQVAAITQVTTSLEELSETASQIASSASTASQAATQTLAIASEVKESSEVAQATSTEGQEAVELSIDSVNRVRNRIELLGQRLLNLTEQTKRVGNIIDLIDEIADETHLLALNASIEAVGGVGSTANTTGSVSTTTASRSERFGIIAQEVKNLADRSRESTQEVRQAIGEMQGAVAGAVLVAEEGKKETSVALIRSQTAGAIIGKLNEVVTNSAQQANQILVAVQEVNVSCDEIKVATSQQRSANQQILLTMRSVSQVSHEGADMASQLSQTVDRVNQQISELNSALARSTQSVASTIAA